MKKSILFSTIAILFLSISLSATTINNNSNKEVLLMKKYSVYCGGVWSGYIWASGDAQAYAIGYDICN